MSVNLLNLKTKTKIVFFISIADNIDIELLSFHEILSFINIWKSFIFYNVPERYNLISWNTNYKVMTAYR